MCQRQIRPKSDLGLRSYLARNGQLWHLGSAMIQLLLRKLETKNRPASEAIVPDAFPKIKAAALLRRAKYRRRLRAGIQTCPTAIS
jgi:hypothetical protein